MLVVSVKIKMLRCLIRFHNYAIIFQSVFVCYLKVLLEVKLLFPWKWTSYLESAHFLRFILTRPVFPMYWDNDHLKKLLFSSKPCFQEETFTSGVFPVRHESSTAHGFWVEWLLGKHRLPCDPCCCCSPSDCGISLTHTQLGGSQRKHAHTQTLGNTGNKVLVILFYDHVKHFIWMLLNIDWR